MRRSRSLRSAKVRTDGSDFLVEGAGDDYGWVSNYASQGGTLGDYDPGGNRPSWWVGSDQDHYGGDYYGIGPYGPGGQGPGMGEWYASDAAYGGLRRGWWNRPHSGQGFLPAVTRCTEVIVQPIVRTAWVVETRNGSDRPPLWVRDPMLIGSVTGETVPQFPAGQRLTGHQFWASVLTHALWWGRGAFVFMEAADKTPLPGSLRQINPFMIDREHGRWVIDPHGDDPLVTDFDGRFTIGGQPWRILVMRGLAPNDNHTPEGVLTRHFDTLRLGAAVNKYVASTFASGVPAGFLKVSTPNMTQDVADKLKKSWMAAHGTGKRSIAVLNATTDFTPISVKPVDTDAANMAHMSRAEIAHAFGLSAIWLDEGASGLTYQNQSDRRRDLVDMTLTGWGQAFTETLSAVLPYGTHLRVMWQTFTAPNLNEQVPTIVQAVGAGLMSVEEGRALLGLDPDTAPKPKPQVHIGPDGAQDSSEVVQDEEVVDAEPV